MKRYIFNLAALLGIICCTQISAYGQGGWGDAFQGAVKGVSEAVEKSGAIEKTKALLSGNDAAVVSYGFSTVAAALAKSGYLTKEKAKPNAQYYIFICSASWCPPCRALMPKVVAEYKKSIQKDDSVSLILLGGDDSPEACKKYLSHYKAKLPALMNSQQIDLPKRPKTPYWPFAFIMDAEGNVITSGHGSIVLDWKNQVQKAGK